MWRCLYSVDELLRGLVIELNRDKGSQGTRQGTISFDEDPKGPEMKRIYSTSLEGLCYDSKEVRTTRGEEHSSQDFKRN